MGCEAVWACLSAAEALLLLLLLTSALLVLLLLLLLGVVRRVSFVGTVSVRGATAAMEDRSGCTNSHTKRPLTLILCLHTVQ